VHLSIKAASEPGADISHHYTDVAKLAEDLKTMELKDVIIKWSIILRDHLDIGSSPQSILRTIVSNFTNTGRHSALWRIMEVTKYRSHVLAARRRAEENFEFLESADKCAWYD
jgi:hypothetical protein